MKTCVQTIPKSPLIITELETLGIFCKNITRNAMLQVGKITLKNVKSVILIALVVPVLNSN